MAILFEIYACNELPIYGKDIIIPFAKIGCILPFQYDIMEDVLEAKIPTTKGEVAIEHTKIVFPK